MLKTREKFRPAGGRQTVLIVDDEKINLQLIDLVLKDKYDTILAQDGETALQIIRDKKDVLSLILTDLIMPGMHGLDLIKIIKNDQQLKHIPVVVMTADADAEVESLQLGAADFIPKPYPKREVILTRVEHSIELSEDRYIIDRTERDTLTDLYNRDYFFGYARQLDQHHKGADMDAIVVDIHHFRMINERHGKAYGDDLLRRIGEKLRDSVRDTGGIVCRREADMFLIYCIHREDYAVILQRASVELSGDGNSASKVRLRMGVYPRVDKRIEMERRFDRAKMAADTIRGNFSRKIAIYDDEMRRSEIHEEHLLEDFQDALAQRQFTVYYQPKFDIRQETPILASAEALIRWEHPVLGMISPGEFIPLFEENGLIQQLDQYVWREAARQIREWKERLGMSVPVSVNVSRVDMYDPNLKDIFLQILEEHSLEPAELLLEITESAYTQDSEQIISTVNHLRELGFLIEMDDFGTGYSSLNMISSLPIDALKLDMKFIRNAFRDGRDTHLIEVIIDIANYLKVPVIAEGVETREQMEALKSMGCDLVQGYYFSKPVPPEEYETFIRQRIQAETEGGGMATPAEERFLQREESEAEGDASSTAGLSEEDNKEIPASAASSDRTPSEQTPSDRAGREDPGDDQYMYTAITRALASDYFRLYTVDTDTGEFSVFPLPGKDVPGLDGEGGNFFERIRANVAGNVYPEDQERILKAFTRENLLKGLEKNGTFTLNCRLMSGDEIISVSMKAARLEQMSDHHIVIGLSNISAQMEQQQEYEASRKNRMTFERFARELSRDYYSIYLVDMGTEEFVEYSSGNSSELHVERRGRNFFKDLYRSLLLMVYREDLEMALSIWDRDRLMAELDENGVFSATYRLMYNETPVYINCKAMRMEDESDRDHIVIGVSNVDAQIRREREMNVIRERVNKDSLTGVKSRNAYMETVAAMDAEILSRRSKPFALVTCSMLEQSPAGGGGETAEDMIRETSRSICSTFDHSPVYRLDGGEFVVIATGVDLENLPDLMKEMADKNRQNAREGGVIIACGCSEFRDDEDVCVENVFWRADTAMQEDGSAPLG